MRGPIKESKVKSGSWFHPTISQDPEDFRKYLQRHDVTQLLTKIFFKLSAERPENPIEFIQDSIEVRNFEIQELKRQLDEANEKIEELQVQNKRLKEASKLHI